MNRMEIERDEQIREIAYRIWQEEGLSGRIRG
jgi:hypothetical protein